MGEFCLIIVLTYGLISYWYQPFMNQKQNYINVVASFSAFSTIYFALVILSIEEVNFVDNAMKTGIVITF